ncbi:MAG: 30S ribosomal protein S17e [Nanoarchaeota archaeon]
MGRIKSTLIKRTARILEKEEGFGEGFERNKKILGSTMPSKSVRNKIAGYIARIKLNRKNERPAAVKPKERDRENRDGREGGGRYRERREFNYNN